MKRRMRRGDVGRGRVVLAIENVSLARDHRARKQAMALAAAGYRVSVICRRDAANRVEPGLDDVRICEYRGPSEARSALGFVREYGVSLLSIFAWCVRLAVEEGFDVLQVGSPPDVQFLVALPFRLFGCKLVVDQRDLSPEVFTDRYGKEEGFVWSVLRVCERRSWRTADHTITVNGSLAETIARRGGISDAAVTIVGNGPRQDRVGCPRPELKHGRRFLVVWMGLMGPQDHAELALKAAHEVLRTFGRADCYFVFIGDGEMLASLQRSALDLGIATSVTFTGWLTEAGYVDYLATADVALDSNLQPEVTPVKGLEYLSFGVPVVAFDLRETRTLVGGAGLYAPPGDSLGLAEHVVALLDDDARRVQMGSVGRSRIESTFAWEHQARAYLSVFAGLGVSAAAAELTRIG